MVLVRLIYHNGIGVEEAQAALKRAGIPYLMDYELIQEQSLYFIKAGKREDDQTDEDGDFMIKRLRKFGSGVVFDERTLDLELGHLRAIDVVLAVPWDRQALERSFMRQLREGAAGLRELSNIMATISEQDSWQLPMWNDYFRRATLNLKHYINFYQIDVTNAMWSGTEIVSPNELAEACQQILRTGRPRISPLRRTEAQVMRMRMESPFIDPMKKGDDDVPLGGRMYRRRARRPPRRRPTKRRTNPSRRKNKSNSRRKNKSKRKR